MPFCSLAASLLNYRTKVMRIRRSLPGNKIAEPTDQVISCRLLRGTRVNNKKLLLWLLLLLLAITGCQNVSKSKDIFVRTDKSIPAGYEHIGDIKVDKGGYYFLWFIPFANGTEKAAKAMMKREAIVGFPDADGLYDYHVELQESVEFLDWGPRVVVRARAVRKIR